MSSVTKALKIGDNEFVVNKIPPFQALKIMGNLQRELTPILAPLADTKEGQMPDFERVLEVLGPRIDGDSLMKWADTLLTPDYVSFGFNGNIVALTKDHRDLAFSDPMQILEVMYELLRFNFEEPLRSFASRFGKLLPTQTKATA